MAADLERLAREFKGDQFKHLRSSLKAQAEIARQLGAPEHFPLPASQESSKRIKPETSQEPFTLEVLQAETERQARRHQELEFHKHKKLRMSKGKFKDAIMFLLIPQPENFVGRFDIPTLAFGQISPKDQCKLAGIDYKLDGLEVSDWQEDPGGFRTPDKIYMNWMYDGGKNLKTAVSTVRANLLKDVRGATYYDGIGLYVARPEILKDHYIDLPGTSVGSGNAPCLSLFYGRPRLHDGWVDSANVGFGSALCGRI